MWTEMYYRLRNALIAWNIDYFGKNYGNGPSSGTSTTITVPRYYDISGTARTSIGFYGTAPYPLSMHSFSSKIESQDVIGNYNGTTFKFLIGTGTGEATVKDYRMISQITAGFSQTPFNNFDIESGHFSRGIVVTSSKDGLSISEIGISGTFLYNYSSSNKIQVLLYHQFLEEPIVLNKGESFTFTLTDDLPMIEY